MAYIGKTPTPSPLTSSDISDGIIITDKLANNAVVTSKITDGTIATADVADNAINLAKMASGTDGNIISYDASGNPVAVATGSSGQVLTSAGAGSPPTFAAAPAAGMTLLDTVSVTSGTIANITTGAIFSATYNSYRIMLDQFKHTEPSALYFQVGNASGLQTSYNWSSIGLRENNVQNTGATAGGNIKLYGQDNSNDYKTNSNQGMPSGYIDLFNVYTTGNTHIQGRFTFGNATNNGAQNNVIGGIVLTATQYDRYKISVSNGSIGATTKVRTYGFSI